MVRPRYWVLDEVKVKDSGELLTEVVACFDGGRFEILRVVPLTEGASDYYGGWIRDRSRYGERRLPLPGEVRVVGTNRTVTVEYAGEPLQLPCDPDSSIVSP